MKAFPRDTFTCPTFYPVITGGRCSRQIRRYFAILNCSPECIPDKFNEFFVCKTEEIRSNFGPDRPMPTNPVEFSGTVFAEFQLVTENFAKTVVQEMPQKSCDLDPIPIPVLRDCLDEIIPTVTSIINKSLSSGIVPECFKNALVKPLLKKRPVIIRTA